MDENENNNNNILNNINNISSSINEAMNNPIVLQLIEFGFNPIYSQRIFIYYHPKNIDDAMEYLSQKNGKMQHHFVQDRNNPENNLCYLCGEEKDNHIINNNNNDDSFEEDIKVSKISLKESNNIEKKEIIKEIECSTCNELFIPTEKNTLSCGHTFCDGCWYDYLSI